VTIVLTLLLRRVRALGKVIRDREGARLAVIGAFVLFFGLVMAGEYVMFRQGLGEVLDMGPPGAALTLYILESFLILILVISVMSFVAGGLATFFRAADTAFLLSTPLPLTRLFWLRAAETFLLTSWAFVIVGVPGFLALGAAYGQRAVFYPRALVALIIFMTLTAGIGTLLTTLAGAAFGRYRGRTRILLPTLILAGAFAFLVGLQVAPSAADFYLIFEPGMANGKPASLKFIEKRFWLWPSHPLALSLFSAVTTTTAGSDLLTMATWLLPAVALIAAGTLGQRLFAATLPVVAEGLGGSTRAAGRAGSTEFPRFLSGPVGALIERDLVGLVRSPKELGQAAFVAFLLILYTAILLLAPLSQVFDKAEAVARLVFLDLAALGYFLTAFGIRFVFPGLSLEGRGAWILFTSPVSIGKLLLAKLLASSALLLLAVGPIAAAGALRFISAPVLLGIFGFLLALMTVTTASVSLACGVLWPNFKETNPERLATNAGGLANILLCLGYVGAVAWLGRGAAGAFFRGEPLLGHAAGALVLSVAVGAGAAMAARRRIKRLEIL
jgi:hypothetical protein